MWEKDRLNRKAYADFLCTLIKNSDKYKRSEKEDSYVIALDSAWGTGKTYFLEVMEEYLEREHGVGVIHYSAWENDFWDNAFIPLLYVVWNHPQFKWDMRGEEGKKYVKDILRLAVCLGREAGLKRLEAVLGEDGVEMLKDGMDHAEEHPTESTGNIFQDYEDFQKAFDVVRRMLSECSGEKGTQEKMLVVIDELDRCRPDFAVQTLEVVKHLFNVEGLVFLFAVDMEQLGSVIRGIYGEGLDARSYLNRMFHYVTHLPDADAGEYWKMLYQEKISNFQPEHQEKEHVDALADCMRGLAEGFHLSLRELDTIWKNYLVLYDYKLKEYLLTEAHQLYLIFLVMKYKIPDLSAYLREHGCTSLKGMEELGACIGSIPEGSCLKEAFQHSAIQPLSRIKGWLSGSGLGASGRREGICIWKADRETLSMKTGEVSERRFTLTDDSCFAGILYAPDFVGWEHFKSLSLVEYMKEQLELFTFTGE